MDNGAQSMDNSARPALSVDNGAQCLDNVSKMNMDSDSNMCDDDQENEQLRGGPGVALPDVELEEAALKESDCSAAVASQGEGNGVIKAPEQGMPFDSADDLFAFYKIYGIQEGFEVMRRNSKRDDDGQIRLWTFACAQSGKSRLRGLNRANPNYIEKTDCNAKVSASLHTDGRLRVDSICLEHNHPLSPGNVKSFRRKRERMTGGEHSKPQISYHHFSDSLEMQRYNELCSVANELNNLAMGSEDTSRMLLKFYQEMKEKLCTITNSTCINEPATDMMMDPSPSAWDDNSNQDVKAKRLTFANAAQRGKKENDKKEETDKSSKEAETCEGMDLLSKKNIGSDSNISSKDPEIEQMPSMGLDEAAVEGKDCLAGIISEKGKEVLTPPHPGMLFDSVDELFEYYKSYGNQEGFQVMKRTRKRDDDGIVRYWTFACAQNGKSRSRKRNQLNLTGKTECSAKISASLYVDGGVRINSVFLEHSHSLNRMFLRKMGNQYTSVMARRIEPKVNSTRCSDGPVYGAVCEISTLDMESDAKVKVVLD